MVSVVIGISRTGIKWQQKIVTREQQPEGWNQPCLEEHLAEIATSIVKWREISPFLGITELLGSAPHSVLEQKIAMLDWEKRKERLKQPRRMKEILAVQEIVSAM